MSLNVKFSKLDVAKCVKKAKTSHHQRYSRKFLILTLKPVAELSSYPESQDRHSGAFISVLVLQVYNTSPEITNLQVHC